MIPLAFLLAFSPPTQTRELAVAIMPPVSEGLATHTAERVTEPVRSTLARAAVKTVDLSERCPQLDAACEQEAVKVAVEQGASHLVRTRITKSDSQETGDVQLLLELSDWGGHVLTTVDELCELCGEAELIQRVTEVAAGLVGRIDRLHEEPTKLIVEGSPAGAWISVDGERIGQIPFDGQVAPGAHELVIEADGHLAQRREVSLTGALTERLEVKLAQAIAVEPEGPTKPGPPAKPEPPADDLTPLVPAGWGLIGAGAAGVVAGAVLVGLAGQPHRPTCSDELVDPNGMCPNVYTTLGGGVAGLVAGAAGIAAGVAMVVIGRKKRVQVGGNWNQVTLLARF